MDAKVTLTYRGEERAVLPDEFKNWADVVCSYSRSDYGGVVRKFTSKFEFVGGAKKRLLDIYLRDGVEAQCDLAVHEFTENWTYRKIFECPLDFSTISWDDYTITISAVDSSLAAMIKADKGTKYEFVVGQDITPDGIFMFDRIPMSDSATYAFTQGESDDNGAIRVTMSNGDLPWLGNIANDVSVGNTILYKDDQDPSDGGCVLVAHKDTTVTLDWSIDIDRRVSSGSAFGLSAQVKRGSIVKSAQRLGDFLLGGDTIYEFVGSFSSESDLPAPGTDPSNTKNWALVNGIVWKTVYKGYGCEWESLGITEDEWLGRDAHNGTLTIEMSAGDRLVIYGEVPHGTTVFKLNSSRFEFTWQSTGEPCEIPMFTPQTVCEAILKKIVGYRFNAAVEFSDYDTRLAKTRLMAAESIRDLAQPKLYSSFSEFAAWMETVFGYVYWIGEPYKRYDRIVDVGAIVWTPYTFEANMFHGNIDAANIVYIPHHGKLLYHDPSEDKYYISFDGYEAYMDNYSNPLPGVLYRFASGLYYFNPGDNEPHRYDYNPTMAEDDFVMVHFQHRSELFGDTVGRTIDNVKELRYTIDRAQIYSTIEVGYEKKDYDSVNGRDEFNFMHTYTTGTSVSEKKLSLVSKYRADSYGIEFAAQKRGAKTADTTSDQDVFFAYCTLIGRNAKPDRTAGIVGTLNHRVFNMVYNPMSCAVANAGFIGMQSAALCLKFASSTGNSDITVGGVAANADILLDTPLLTAGVVEFQTDDQEAVTDFSKAVKIVSNGIEYVGFISDLDIKCFRGDAAKYKLLIKSVNVL